jgi:hypothetical protein
MIIVTSAGTILALTTFAAPTELAPIDKPA